MPESVGGALRAAIVATGAVNARVFRDRAPDGATMPYVTFLEPLSMTPVLSGDGDTVVRETQAQLSLWQRVKEEDPSLLAVVAEAVDGADLLVDDGRKVWRAKLTSLVRVDDPDALVVHHALTVSVKHRGI